MGNDSRSGPLLDVEGHYAANTDSAWQQRRGCCADKRSYPRGAPAKCSARRVLRFESRSPISTCTAVLGAREVVLEWVRLKERPRLKGGDMSTYRAIEVNKPGEFSEVRKPLLDPGPNQVRIRVEACGVCHSDSATIEGLFPIDWPRVPGHEVVGRIDALGSGVQGWAVGQ